MVWRRRLLCSPKCTTTKAINLLANEPASRLGDFTQPNDERRIRRSRENDPNENKRDADVTTSSHDGRIKEKRGGNTSRKKQQNVQKAVDCEEKEVIASLSSFCFKEEKSAELSHSMKTTITSNKNPHSDRTFYNDLLDIDSIETSETVDNTDNYDVIWFESQTDKEGTME